jgi:tetrahydromethanopterin S-methyltransferase subunit B
MGVKLTRKDLFEQINKLNELADDIRYLLDTNDTLDYVQLHTGYKLLHDSINNLYGVKKFFEC